MFVRKLDVVVNTQHKHLCSWIYSSCLCINNYNLIGSTKLVVYTTLFLCKQLKMLCEFVFAVTNDIRKFPFILEIVIY